ncbi:hypothetical protein GCM10009624_08170 [Gordonia sinesedis]
MRSRSSRSNTESVRFSPATPELIEGVVMVGLLTVPAFVFSSCWSDSEPAGGRRPEAMAPGRTRVAAASGVLIDTNQCGRTDSPADALLR